MLAATRSRHAVEFPCCRELTARSEVSHKARMVPLLATCRHHDSNRSRLGCSILLGGCLCRSTSAQLAFPLPHDRVEPSRSRRYPRDYADALAITQIPSRLRRYPRDYADAPAFTRWECHHHPTHPPRWYSAAESKDQLPAAAFRGRHDTGAASCLRDPPRVVAGSANAGVYRYSGLARGLATDRVPGVRREARLTPGYARTAFRAEELRPQN